MTVYVDDFAARHQGMIMCHMIADTMDELHAMARTINLWSGWLHGDHYDLSLTKRKLAIAAGARVITLRQCAQMMAQRRAGLPLGTPEQAQALMVKAWTDRGLPVPAYLLMPADEQERLPL